jgi:hypothetical protein
MGALPPNPRSFSLWERLALISRTDPPHERIALGISIAHAEWHNSQRQRSQNDRFSLPSQSGLGITPSLVSERTGLRTRRSRDSALKGSNNPQGADSCDTMPHSWANASRVTQSRKTVRSISGPETARIDRISRRCLSERPSR